MEDDGVDENDDAKGVDRRVDWSVDALKGDEKGKPARE
jgi:hypothetical protein